MKLRALFGAKDGPVRTSYRNRKEALRAARARRVRGRLRNTRLVAVTGSGGKTTATALLGAILAECGPTHASLYANTLHGISKRLTMVDPANHFAVFEAGMDKPGGMALSARALAPDVAVLTGIGLDHRKTFRSKEAIADEKGDLFAALGPDAVAVLNADDDMMPRIAARTKARIVLFGTGAGAEVRAENIEAAVPGGLRMDIVQNGARLAVKTNLIGGHWTAAVLAAVAAARELGAPDEAILRAVAAFAPIVARCSPHRLEDGSLYLLDTLKAPYDTIGLALALMQDVEAPRRTVIIGNISDYPGTARTKYQRVYEEARRVADRVIFFGDQAARVRPHEDDVRAARFFTFEDIGSLTGFLAQTRAPGEVVLVKGAGVDHLERVALHQQQDITCWEGRCGVPGTCFTCGRLRSTVQ